jgi:hypothetical protein
LLGRLVQDGIVQRLLDDRCPHAAYALCPYRDALPATADAFLWKSPSPLYRIGGWDLPATHANAMILDSIRAYPLMHLRAFVRNTGAQLIRTHIEVSVETEDLFITRHIRRRFRREYPAFATSLQQQGRLVPRWLAPMHDWVIAASALGSLGLVALALTGLARPVTLPLHLFMWAALLLNAAVAANISDIVARYQGRLVWVMPLAVLMTLVTERRARTSTVIRTARTLDASDSDSVRGVLASSASGPSVIRRAPH